MLKIENVKISDITPYKHNAKQHPAEQVEQIAASIRQFGMNDPLAIDEENVIIEGHGRLLAIQKMRAAGEYTEETVPCIRLTHLTDQQKKAYILAHNKLTMNSGFDLDILSDELERITDFDMSDFGFIDEDDEEEQEPHEDNYDEAIPAIPKAKRGDVYRLGQHRLMCGDSTDPADVATLMDGELADLLLTDPPYNVQYEGKTKKRLRIENDAMSEDNFTDFLIDAFQNADNAMHPGASFYIWHGDAKRGPFLDAIEETGWLMKQVVIWVKSTFALGRQDYQWQHEPCLYGWKDGEAHYFTESRKETTVYEEHPEEIEKLSKDEMKALLLRIFSEAETQTTVIHEDKPNANDLHPTMKPIPLFGRLIKNSTKEGDLVLDLFAGSGTTAIAAEQLGRRAFLMEYDPRYADTIIDRWERYTGEKAELIAGPGSANI